MNVSSHINSFSDLKNNENLPKNVNVPRRNLMLKVHDGVLNQTVKAINLLAFVLPYEMDICI